MLQIDRRFRFVGAERIRVITERAEHDPMAGERRLHLRRISFREVSHVDVGDARVTPLRFADRPAHRFDAREIFRGGKGEDFLER